eukprot:scaffold16029_cov35-Cyclotella_meneghiniana.AAC.1
MIVGAAACFSRKTLKDIAQVYKTMLLGSKRGERGKCEDRAEASEEVTTSWNRKEQGEWWFWKGEPEGAGEEEECCAHRPIGLHKYKLPSEIQRLDLEFFGSTDGETYKKLDAKTKRYVDQVRGAMGISDEGFNPE